jgi:hypothetical protein
MNPAAKTVLIVLGAVLGIFAVPAVLIVFHDYINAFLAIALFLACFVLFGCYSYQELLPVLQAQQIEEEKIFHQFHGDKDKIRYYKGFRKHFAGELNLEQLKKWFERHPHRD